MNGKAANATSELNLYESILAFNQALNEAPRPHPTGYIRDNEGEWVFIASGPDQAEAMRKAYPELKVIVPDPAPTAGNPPHRKGRPKGL